MKKYPSGFKGSDFDFLRLSSTCLNRCLLSLDFLYPVAITSKFYNIEGVLRLLQHPYFTGMAGKEKNLTFMDVHYEMEG